MLATLLLAGIVAAPLGSAGLFMPARRRARATGAWPAVRRLVLAVTETLILAAAVAAALFFLGTSRSPLVAGVAAFAAASLIWLPVTRRWRARAHLCWASSVFLFAVYLAFALDWTFASRLGPAGTAGGVVLWVLEVLAVMLSCAYLWEICDALGAEHWRRRVTPTVEFSAQEEDLPFVSLHVPAHNEPPDMVIETLSSLLRLDYPRYEVILIDDNTDDERLWRPVQAWCAEHGVTFVHLQDWPGYKSGALNYALRNLTDPRAELIGVVDSDYQIVPGFLRRCAPAFDDPWVGFIQAPQDYRDWEHAPYYRRLYYSYKYFFAVSQPSRNERDGAIFAGTMGLIRRVALDQLCGWDEWCITEDAELSVRLLRAAGPWATGRPASLDPSYWSLPALQGLARLTGRAEWRRLAAGAVTLTRRLTQDGRLLPPDWAELTAAGALRPEAAPNGSQPQTQYGLDAQRTVAWFAASCDRQARALAARWWPLLRTGGRAQALALQPDGTVLDALSGALPLVASAAAAHAAGDGPAAGQMLRRAGQVQRRYPTYYGGAWDALGMTLLTSRSLSAC